MVYLAVRSFFVRLEITDDHLLVHGWFRNRSFAREQVRRVDHVRGPIPLAVAVSMGVRAIPQSWFLVLTTSGDPSLALDSTLARYSDSNRQINALRSWLTREGRGAQ
ncbi:hypothetical protein [Microbacterium sp. NPDC056569]|uniref:hypothetical protein n=1 Tax=Microbacterium sp. NPDC056569 TaxID=3345867 RepID=UPI00366A8E09